MLRTNKEELKTTKEDSHHKVNNKQDTPQTMPKDQVNKKDQQQLATIKDPRFLQCSQSNNNSSSSISPLRAANSSSQDKLALLMIVCITTMGTETLPSKIPTIWSNHLLCARRGRRERKELSRLMRHQLTLF